MHSVADAVEIIARITQPLRCERVRVEKAYGRMLKEPICLVSDAPPFDRALVDGFALRSIDAAAGIELLILGRQDAGGPLFTKKIEAGTCVAINTGATVPPSTDAVIMVEKTERKLGAERVRLREGIEAGAGIQRRGGFARRGDVAIERDTILNAGSLAAAISAGVSEVTVQRVPTFAVLTTGDELREAGTALPEGTIHNSNLPLLVGLVREAGGQVVDLGMVADEEGAIRGALARGRSEADVLLVSGGMSMGTKDFVPRLLREMGYAFHIEKVTMKPGKPFVFGAIGEGAERKYVCGLPGNPVSTFVTFHIFVREMLRCLLGMPGKKRTITARVTAGLEGNGPRTFFMPCRVRMEGGNVFADPIKWKGSGDALALQGLEAAILREVDAPAVEAGMLVEVMLF